MPLPDPRVVVLADGPADPFAAALGECLAAVGIEPEDDVASADVVLTCLPWRRLRDAAPGIPLGPDAVLVACTTGLAHDADGWWVEDVPGGSVVGMLSDLLPGRRVVGALQLLTADQLLAAAAWSFATDVPVTGDDPDAVALVSALVDLLPGLDAVGLGGSRTAGAVEGLAAVVREVADPPGGSGALRLGGATPTALRLG